MQRSSLTLALLLSALPFAGFAACSAAPDDNGFTSGNGSGGAGNGVGNGQGGGLLTVGVGGGGGGSTIIETCEQAEAAKSYIGCDFWPTVVANNVWSIFDYAVVVANAGDEQADVTVTRGGNTVAQDTVPANGLKTIYLPWVPELKGPDADECGSATPLSSTVKLANGAYHLVTSRPVTVYQFSALEYGPQGGPPGKNWSACPSYNCFFPMDCFSYSNDASLLLPSTALTGNYRVTGLPGWSGASISAYIAITGTQNTTNVTVSLTGAGVIQGGSGIPSANGGGQVTFTLQAGEVAEILGTPDSDLSGSLVQADKPVQVIFGLPCVNIPESATACDHIEESVFPAETLGRRYFVNMPSGPEGSPVGQVVRIYGNVDNTALTYPAGTPPGAPATINAGQVVDLGPVSQNFEIAGDKEFAVGMFQMGASAVGGASGRGDPAQSLATAVEQYRTKYVFLAPMDYEVNYVDVVMPLDATISIDGMPVAGAPTPIGSGFGVAHVQLGPGNQGQHVLEATAPVGIQVLGYGSYTSYQYPGGSDLNVIAPPPGQVE